MKSMDRARCQKIGMRRERPGWVRLVSLIGLACAGVRGFSQGAIMITFDQPPSLPPGTGLKVSEYVEAGIRFRPLYEETVISQGVFRFRGPYWDFPDNGTTYFGGTGNRTNTLTFGRADRGAFSLMAVELADFCVHSPGPGTVQFVGYRLDGSVVRTEFALARVVVNGRPEFESFRFGPEFSDLEHVEVPTQFWWMDNLVIYIPEPSSLALLVLGGGGWLVARRCRCRGIG